jgi:hypothetical protein
MRHMRWVRLAIGFAAAMECVVCGGRLDVSEVVGSGGTPATAMPPGGATTAAAGAATAGVATTAAAGTGTATTARVELPPCPQAEFACGVQTFPKPVTQLCHYQLDASLLWSFDLQVLNVAVDCVLLRSALDMEAGGARETPDWLLIDSTSPPMVEILGETCQRIQRNGLRVDVLVECPGS